jgi:hypothetical protein
MRFHRVSVSICLLVDDRQNACATAMTQDQEGKGPRVIFPREKNSEYVNSPEGYLSVADFVKKFLNTIWCAVTGQVRRAG